MQVSCIKINQMLRSHDCSDELREVSLKATPARLAVLRELEKTDKPLDVGSIIFLLRKKGVKADPATVFRIMNSFRDRGLTDQLQFNEGKFRYELASKFHHHHLVCEVCGAITDMPDNTVENLEKEISSQKGFIVRSHSLEFFGVCKSCIKTRR